MKKITIIFTILITSLSIAQVAIGKNGITKLSDGVTPNPSISLEFYDAADNAKGIVVPWVSTVADNPVIYNATTRAGYRGMQGAIVDGTIIFDLSDKKMKYMKDGSWFDLTGNIVFPLTVKDSSNNDITFTAFNTIDSSLQDNKKEQENAKAAIGINSATDTTTGILVLTDTDKAMVLPKVASPHLNIINPSAGMMVYDTTAKQLAVYNGTVWSFWKP
ncbi:hypothetical protein [Chryseobacterium oryctis]|uniref:Uncharacterized protein n=1 Tax=Chryseobacterium oryctis TaxID=2952618 RepID=A0ABT3HM40_9FLAO|nr:hypothetical protein [Chryseobacterium oryctis]MCW3160829.1 hypothetical protein [Chryseobacterium oryctis]